MESSAIPLCLPDNCSWDEHTNEYKTHDTKRCGLVVINAALRKLESIQGDVCVVGIAGPCRKGKSFILSKPFDERDVFPLGHQLDPETMGIWMWVVPERFKDRNDREFTVVLLDSEGTDSCVSATRDDNIIFTLIVLLSSVLIFNSSDVPTRSDLEFLDYVSKLSQRIQVFQDKEFRPEHAQMSFPHFFWLLRDVTKAIPEDCENIDDYFYKKVFSSRSVESPGAKPQQAADTILNCFPSFQSLTLPLPSYDSKTVQSLSNPSSKDSINIDFLDGLDIFNGILRSLLQPKKSPDGKGVVNGEALAWMVESYVSTLNTPGAVPFVAGVWEAYTEQTANESFNMAEVVYFLEMKDNLEGKSPCDSVEIRQLHKLALGYAKEVFDEKTKGCGIPTGKLQQYKHDLQVKAERIESDWLRSNNDLTEKNCEMTFRELKRSDLVTIKNLWKTQNTSLGIACIESAYAELINKLRTQCRGCRDFIDSYAFLRQEELDEDMYNDIALVRQFGEIRDKLHAHRVNLEEMKQDAQRMTGANNAQVKARLEELDHEISQLREERQTALLALCDANNAELLHQNSVFKSKMNAEKIKAQRDIEQIEQVTKTLQSQLEELKEQLEERERVYRNLRR